MNMPDKEYYRNLITSEYRLAPHFNAMVRGMVDYNCKLDRFIMKMVEHFDVASATGDQLDILGDCVGVSRNLDFEPTPAATGSIICPGPEAMEKDNEAVESELTTYKTPAPVNVAETDTLQGWAPSDMQDMPLISDDIYRRMIMAKIIQNVWKGNVLELYEMWDALFPENQGLQIQDLQDMSFNIVLIGNFSQLLQELILHGYIIPKPEGVRINMLSFISNDGRPIFSYKYNNLNWSGYKSHWIQIKKE